MKEISKELLLFYKNLYSAKGVDHDIQRDFLEAGVKKLSADGEATCDREITTSELGAALKSLPNNKTPGTDGISTEFYKCWWSDIIDLVLDGFNHSLITGRLSIDQRRGVITLLPKKG